MKQFKPREVTKALERKGFVKERSTKHLHYFFYVNGKRTSVHTFLSHGNSPIGTPNIKRMSSQMKLSTEEFEDFVNCPLSQEKYTRHLEKVVDNFQGI